MATKPTTPFVELADDADGLIVAPEDWERDVYMDPRSASEEFGGAGPANHAAVIRAAEYYPTEGGNTLANIIAHGADIGTGNLSLVADHLRYLQAVLSRKQSIAWQSQTRRGAAGRGVEGGNFSNQRKYRGGISTNSEGICKLTIVNAAGVGYCDPRIQTITPEDTVYFGSSTATGSVRADIKAMTEGGENALVTEYVLASPLPDIGGELLTADIFIWQQDEPYRYEWIEPLPAVPDYSMLKSSGWIAAASLPNDVGDQETYRIYELLGPNDSPCRINYPHSAAFRVLASTAATAPTSTAIEGATYDATSYFTANYEGLFIANGEWTERGAVEPKLWVSWEGGAFHTYIRLDKALANFFFIDFAPIVDVTSQEQSLALRGFAGCAFNLVDWGNACYGATTGFSWVAREGDVTRYCSLAFSGAKDGLPQYNFRCNNTRCPKYLSMTYRDPTTGAIWHRGHMHNIDIEKWLWGAGGVYYWQPTIGVTEYEYGLGWGAAPGILFQTGGKGLLRGYSTDHQEDWEGHGEWGILDTETEPTAAAPYMRLIKGPELMRRIGYTEQMDCLGQPMHDWTDYKKIQNSFPGWREALHMPRLTLDPFGYPLAKGWTEMFVQRPVRRRIVLPGIDLSAEKVGVSQSIEGHTVTHVIDGANNYLRVELRRQGVMAIFPAIYTVEYVPPEDRRIFDFEIEDDRLTVWFTPGIDYGFTENPLAYHPFVCGGHAVITPDERSLKTVANSARRSMIGKVPKLQLGATGYFPSLDGLSGYGLTCLSAQAHGERVYNGGPVGWSGEEIITATLGGVIRPTVSGWSFVRFENPLTGYQTGKDNVTYGDFAAWEDPDISPHLIIGAGSASMWVTAPQTDMETLLVQYVSTGNDDWLQVGLRYSVGGTETTITASFLVENEGPVAGKFLSVPSIPLHGWPDYEQPITIEVWNPLTSAYQAVGVTLTHDGNFEQSGGPTDPSYYPQYAIPPHGHTRAYKKNKGYWLVLPTEFWGYQLRVTLAYDASDFIDPADVAQGIGLPIEEISEGVYDIPWRLNMDTATFSLRGYHAEQIRDALQNILSAPGGYEANSLSMRAMFASVLPPTHRQIADGTYEDVPAEERPLTIEHVPYIGGASVMVADIEDLSAWNKHLEDRANGVVYVACGDWDTEIKHALYFQGVFLDMPNRFGKEFWEGALAAVEVPDTMRISYANGGIGYVLKPYAENPPEGMPHDPDGDFPDDPDAFPWVMDTPVDVRTLGITSASTYEPVAQMVGGQVYTPLAQFGYAGRAIRGTGGYVQSAGFPSGLLHILEHAHNFPLLFSGGLTMRQVVPVGGLNRSEIKQVWADIDIEDFTLEEWEQPGTQTFVRVDSDPAKVSALGVTGAYVTVADITDPESVITDQGFVSQVSNAGLVMSGGHLKGTVDITELYLAAHDNSDPNTIYGLVITGGGSSVAPSNLMQHVFATMVKNLNVGSGYSPIEFTLQKITEGEFYMNFGFMKCDVEQIGVNAPEVQRYRSMPLGNPV